MLVLSRRIREAIIIDDKIAIQVLGIYGNQVKLGIHAPHKISIHREEVYRKMHPTYLAEHNTICKKNNTIEETQV